MTPGSTHGLTPWLPRALGILLGVVGAAGCGDSGGGNDSPDAGNNNASPLCGDGVREGVEECDDGAANSDSTPDACRTDCRAARCGDGTVDGPEQCDDGPANSDSTPDACRSDCVQAGCGDRVVDVLSGETCDCGRDATALRAGCPAENGHPDSPCGPGCQVRFCGNGLLDPGERCDDGNWDPGDGCSPDCLSLETCGNGRTDFLLGEQCDDGNLRSGDGCSSGCQVELTSWTTFSGGFGAHAGMGLTPSPAGDRLVLFGGIDSLGPNLKTFELTSTQWLDTSPSSSPNESNGRLVTDTGSQSVLWVAPGASGMSLWRYNGSSWTPVSAGAAPPARSSFLLAFDEARDRLVLFGGIDQVTSTTYSDTWEHDGTTWVERTDVGTPPHRTNSAQAYDAAAEEVVLFGGFVTGVGWRSDTWRYDGTAWRNVSQVARPPGRAASALAYDAHRAVLVLYAGAGNGNLLLQDTWELSGNTWTERTTATTPGYRGNHAMAFWPERSQVVLVGGRDDVGMLEDTWTFDGTDWAEITPASVPAARLRHMMAFDEAREVTLVYGGENLAYQNLGDTWQFDGRQWLLHQPSSTPGLRKRAALVYDAARERLVLFGGAGVPCTPRCSDTWEWDGANWHERPLGAAPPGRAEHALAYDRVRQRVVLFGGEGDGVYLGDTWEYDGAAWVEITPGAAPAPRSGAAMVFDEERERVVLFGGRDAAQVLGDTWEYDGTAWTEIATTASPEPRSYAELVYDAHRARIVLVDGYGAAGALADLWEWDGNAWLEVTPTLAPARQQHRAVYDRARGAVLLLGGFPFADTRLWIYGFSATEPAERCDDALDNDLDGLIDCADPDCNLSATCASSPELCRSGADEDGDSLVDCADPNCGGHRCAEGGTCWAGTCCTGLAEETPCTDGIDNDCDGLIDCQDRDCALTPSCAQP